MEVRALKGLLVLLGHRGQRVTPETLALRVLLDPRVILVR